MGKVFFTISLLLLFFLLLFNTASTAKAADTIFIGPIKLEGVHPGAANQTSFQITVRTTNPDNIYTLDSKSHQGSLECKNEMLMNRPCIDRLTLLADSGGGTTHIEIIDAVSLKNGVIDPSWILIPLNPTNPAWDAKAGEETGWVTYKQEKQVGIPTIDVVPSKITKAGKVSIKVTLIKPLAGSYMIKVNPEGSGTSSTASVNVSCDSVRETCRFIPQRTENFSSSADGTEFSFELSGLGLVVGKKYEVNIESPSLTKAQSDQIRKIFEVELQADAITVKLDKPLLKEEETKNATIQVTLDNGRAGKRYQIISSHSKTWTDVINCAGPGCTYDLKLPSNGLREASYTITVIDNDNKSLQGSAVLIVINKAKGGGLPCGDPSNPAIKTAIGCIHTNPADLTKDLLKFGLGIGGGLSFLMMLFGAFQMMTSAGNPETLNAGRQRLTSAIIGLLFVILSILFLQIIGWNILQLPGFGTK